MGYSLLQKKDDEDEDTLVDDTSIHSTKSYGTLHSDLESNNSQVESKRTLMISIDKYMSPPLYAALLALIVGLCPPLKNLLYNQSSFLYGSFTIAIQTCGKASVPLTLFCLGAQLKSIRETQQKEEKPKKTSRLPVFLTLLLRMIIMPLLVLPIVFIFAKYGSSWSELASDPMFIVSMVIVGCTPTSINLAQITQVSGVYEEEMLSVLFWSYGVICVPVCTLAVFLGLYMVNPV